MHASDEKPAKWVVSRGQSLLKLRAVKSQWCSGLQTQSLCPAEDTDAYFYILQHRAVLTTMLPFHQQIWLAMSHHKVGIMLNLKLALKFTVLIGIYSSSHSFLLKPLPSWKHPLSKAAWTSSVSGRFFLWELSRKDKAPPMPPAFLVHTRCIWEAMENFMSSTNSWSLELNYKFQILLFTYSSLIVSQDTKWAHDLSEHIGAV